MFVAFNDVGSGLAAAGLDEAEAGLAEVGERGHAGPAVSGGFTGGSQVGAEVGGSVCRRGNPRPLPWSSVSPDPGWQAQRGRASSPNLTGTPGRAGTRGFGDRHSPRPQCCGPVLPP